jgi:hypothetical protein
MLDRILVSSSVYSLPSSREPTLTSAVVRVKAPATCVGSVNPKPTRPAALGVARVLPGVRIAVSAMVSWLLGLAKKASLRSGGRLNLTDTQFFKGSRGSNLPGVREHEVVGRHLEDDGEVHVVDLDAFCRQRRALPTDSQDK